MKLPFTIPPARTHFIALHARTFGAANMKQRKQ
jgi:hypothetical protein